MYHLASSVHKSEKCKLKSDYSVTDFENTFFFLMPIMEGAAERSYPTSEVRGSVGEEQPHVQGKEQHLPKSLQMVTAAMKLKDAYSLEGKL